MNKQIGWSMPPAVQIQAKALFKGYTAFLKYREGTSPSIRQKAFREAKTAEDEFITARLSYWTTVLNTAEKAKE